MEARFITFEGSEGCGKSTQSRMLAAYLRKIGYPVVYLREPGGTGLSEKIRKILLNPKNYITPLSETLLYMIARAELVSRVIKPALIGGKIVICDRFLDSTMAYQGYGLGIDIAFIKHAGNLAASGIRPNLTIFLDLPVEKGLRHRKANLDRIEKRSLEYHFRVRQGYLKLARMEPGRIKIIKVAKDKNKTQSDIRKVVLCHLSASKARIRP
ncbi:MAG: dTMP kinase [Candidatus Omnitrophica bacterium]|nr:dTMP kinase [Candidatus Omnitrophota bacterium]